MERPPRARSKEASAATCSTEHGNTGPALSGARAAGLLYVLLHPGWRTGDAVGIGNHVHHRYVKATTSTFAWVVACQLGTASGSRIDRATTHAHPRGEQLCSGHRLELALPPRSSAARGAARLPYRVHHRCAARLHCAVPLIVWEGVAMKKTVRRHDVGVASGPQPFHSPPP